MLRVVAEVKLATKIGHDVRWILASVDLYLLHMLSIQLDLQNANGFIFIIIRIVCVVLVHSRAGVLIELVSHVSGLLV